MDPLFVCYFTPGPYEQEFLVLEECFKALKLDYQYVRVPSLGSWQKNTQLKAHAIREFLKNNPSRRIVYLDVDSLVIHKPELFWTLDCDVAAVMFRDSILLSGVVMFDSTIFARDVVERWIELNRMYPETLPDGRPAWDQRTLQMAIKDQSGARFAALPQSYNWMPGPALTQGFYQVDPVIIATRGALKHQKDA